jgi:hypothetical protein
MPGSFHHLKRGKEKKSVTPTNITSHPAVAGDEHKSGCDSVLHKIICVSLTMHLKAYAA